MANFLASFLVLALCAGCAPSHEGASSVSTVPERSPYDDPKSQEWDRLDSGAKKEIATVLGKYPTVRRAYLLKRLDPDMTFKFVLDIEFDGEPVSAAVNEATNVFNRLAAGNKTLEILLPTPESQARIVEQAKATPFYERQ